MILGLADHPKDVVEKTDVVVVGSGAGGATVARMLAQRGLSVVVIEKGGHPSNQEYSQRSGPAYSMFYAEAGQRVMMGPVFVPLLQGESLGGSTVVNSAICFRPPKSSIERWQRDVGFGIEYEQLIRRADELWEYLKIAPTRSDVAGGNNAMMRRGVEALGWVGGPIHRNAELCTGCGVCHFGCPTGGKNSMDRSSLPDAVEHGARIYLNAQVEQVLGGEPKAQGVVGSFLHPKSREAVGSFRIEARATVLSAGAVGTPLILMESGLCQSNEHLGQHLHVHPASGSLARFPEEVKGWIGVTQGFFCEQFHESEDILLETGWTPPEMLASFFPFGPQQQQAMMHLANMGIVGGEIRDQSEGSVRTGRKARPRLRYNLVSEDRDKLLHIMRRSAQIEFAAGASDVRFKISGSPSLHNMDEVEQALRHVPRKRPGLYGSHPQSTCAMGEDRSRCVVQSSGETWDHGDLWVADASLFPDAVGVNPQITVMALATLVAEKINERLGGQRLERDDTIDERSVVEGLLPPWPPPPKPGAGS